MRTVFLILFVALVVVVAVVVVGPTLPEGNAIRTMGDSIRDLMSGMGSGFGGGYQPITPSG
jgi:Sec-independent protein translocase protein TatA